MTYDYVQTAAKVAVPVKDGAVLLIFSALGATFSMV